MVKRAPDIAIFLIKNNQFRLDFIQKIWINSQDKHEYTVIAVFDFLSNISCHLNFEGIELLYDQIQKLPFEKYNEQIILLIKKFTENALQILQRFEVDLDLNA